MTLPPQADIPQQLATASAAWIKLRRLAAYAAFDGWTLTIVGALTLVCDGYGSAMGLFISFALLGTGVFEIRAVRQLRRLDPGAISQLAYNQMVLAGALILYSIMSLIQSRGGGGMPGQIQQAFAQAGISGSEMNDQLASLMRMLYSGLIAVALLVQGGTALYYRSRHKHFLRYLQDTPAWIQQMQRERGEISL